MKTLVAAAAMAATALVVPAMPATADQQQPVDTAGGEFVVTYAGGDVAGATAAIEAAGGTVVDVNEALGVALVSAGDGSFVTEVQEDDSVIGAARNHSVGTSRPGMPHRFVEERPSAHDRAVGRSSGRGRGHGGQGAEPLANLQWDMAMIGATPDGAWRRATGDGVLVGIIDTGVDASHPDIAPNFSRQLSRNFTMDIPSVDGPCEQPTCIDPADTDDGGHGTHVAGSVAAARNGLGIAGVAPDATIVNVRAGQDSGFFFLYETVAALVYAGDARLDVVNMSFFTDPWMWNCDSPDDYVSGEIRAGELEQQRMARQLITAALDYAHDRGVSLVAAAGNSHVNLEAPTRSDTTSPNFPLGTAHPRVVTNDCLDLPAEGPDVITVSAVGPSTTKADYSNYGEGVIELSAPGGWFRDGIGTPTFQTPGNMVLSSYPLHVAIAEGLAKPDGTPADAFSVRNCDSRGRCGFYTYLQGTSMASPHAAGVAALIVQAHGRGNARRGFDLPPVLVTQVMERTATDHACPAGGVEIYTDEGRPAEFNAVCEGSVLDNGLYGEGIVNAAAAVARRARP
jgi:subtilisin family serine protease